MRPLPIGRVSRVVRIADRQTMPWKNGGGVTHELFREERDGALSLRLSVAEVAAEGPFSRFEGVDRVILLLVGTACVLTRDDGVCVPLRPRVPFHFLGEDRWTCALPDGPVRDFNVMTARDRSAAVRVAEPGWIVGNFALALEPGAIGGVPVLAEELAVLDGPVWSDVPAVAITISP